MTEMLTMREARRRLALSQVELSQITRVNQAHLSQIETGQRAPSPGQKQRIRAALGSVSFYEEEDLAMSMNVPVTPEVRWNKDGTPDFSHLDDGDSVRDQLDKLIVGDNGEDASLRQVTTDHVYFEVLDEDGGSVVYKQSYLVTNGEAALEGDAVEASEEFETLSRRRIPKAGVPPMPIVDDEN